MRAKGPERDQGRRPFPLLVRHFFDRFFDAESLSPGSTPEAAVVQLLGILAVPSGFASILCFQLAPHGWGMVTFRHIFVSFSMIVMAFITVFHWDALFPDRRDYQILTPLPLRLSDLFLAKTCALTLYLGVFLADLNFFGVLLWPGVDGGSNLLAAMGAHAAAVAAGGVFAALALAAFQGVLLALLPATVLRRVAAPLQTLLMGALVMLLFLTPILGGRVEQLVRARSPLIYGFPGYWFDGLYERLHPALRKPDAVLEGLGTLAVRGLLIAAGMFLLTYLPLYRRHARKVLEAPSPSPHGPGLTRCWLAQMVDQRLLRRPTEQAMFHFIGQTLARSMKHRIFLAVYGGFGAAVGLMTLGEGREGLLRLPLTLSFVMVSGLRAAFNFPSELGANWAFQVTETRRAGEYLAATRKWITLCAIVPLFLVFAPVELASFPWPTALFHSAFGATLAVLLMEVLFYDFRKVPFTCAHFPGKVNLVGLGAMYILGFTMYSRTMAGVEAWLTGVPAAAALFFGVAAMLWLLVTRHRDRAVAGAAALDYEDRGDPVIRTLDLRLQ